MKRPFQPNQRKRKKTHGFLVRMRSVGGRRVINNKRRKGRHKLAVQVTRWAPLVKRIDLLPKRKLTPFLNFQKKKTVTHFVYLSHSMKRHLITNLPLLLVSEVVMPLFEIDVSEKLGNGCD